jgi:hypothetical protein
MIVNYRPSKRYTAFSRAAVINLTLFLLLFKILVPAAQAQTCLELNGSYVYSGGTYLGFFGSAVAADSIMNSVGLYGSSVGVNSVRNSVGLYGSSVSSTSANNSFASNPPLIYKHGVALYYLTTNTFKTPRVSLAVIDASCVFSSFSPITYPAAGPAAVSAADGTSTSVLAVGWTAVAGATSYNVYRSTTNSNYVLLGNTSDLGTTITGLTQGVTYYIAVTAVNGGGESLTYNYDTGYLANSTSYTVTPSTFGNSCGSISPSSAQQVDENDTVQFTVSATGSCELTEVSGTCGGSLSGSTYTTNAITSDCTVRAEFTENPAPAAPAAVDARDGVHPSLLTVSWTSVNDASRYDIYISESNSEASFISVGSAYTTDTNITGLEQGKLYYVGVASYNAFGQSSKTVDTGYLATSHTVTPTAGSGGSISPSSAQEIIENNTTSFTVTADSGYELDSVGGTCGGALSGSTYTTNAITSDCTVSATFSEIVGASYTVTPSAGANGSIEPSTGVTVAEGATTSFTVTADSGYELDSVGGTCGGALSGSTFTTEEITADCTVSAIFSELPAQSCDTHGTSGAYVQKIFIAYLGRPAAPAGLEYFANYMDTNNEQGKLILFDDLYYSAEAEALYSTSTLSEQINQFYQFMFSRDALSGGLNYWINQINGGFFTVPASAAYIADAASGEDMAVLDAKQVAASKLTCAIGDDASKLSAFQANLAGARASLAGIATAEEAEAYDGEAELTNIIGSARTAQNSWSRGVSNAREDDPDARPIPTLTMLGFFILSGLLGLFGIRRLAHR